MTSKYLKQTCLIVQGIGPVHDRLGDIKKKQVLFYNYKQFETHWDKQQKSRRYIV